MGAAVCQVCGVAIVDAPRVCERCETPHHADCWEYTGRCSTYGCMAGGAAAAVAVTEPVGTIVPAGDERGVGCWLTDATGAWIGKRDPRVTVDDGQRVVMLPRTLFRRLYPLVKPVTSRDLVMLMAACVLLLPLFPLVLLGAALYQHFGGRQPDVMWLAKSASGLSLNAATDGKRLDCLLGQDARILEVRLARSYESSPGTGRDALTYRLGIGWMQGERPTESYLHLAPPVQMTDDPRRRREALEQIKAMRALGQHIAQVLSLEYSEGASRV